MNLLIEIGSCGLLIVLVLFAKPDSLPGLLKPAIIGIRILLGIAVIVIILLIKHDNNQNGMDFFGNVKIDDSILIGKWQAEFSVDDYAQYNTTIYSFYPDNTFYSSDDRSESSLGKWQYDREKEILYLIYPDETFDLKLTSFPEERTFWTSHHDAFTRISTLPENKQKVTFAIQQKKKNESKKNESNKSREEKLVPYDGIALLGVWGLKEIKYEYGLNFDLGAYTLSSDGIGSFKDEYHSGTVKYMLDKDKKRLTLARDDRVYSININSFSSQQIVGYATGEKGTKYVFSKAF